MMKKELIAENARVAQNQDDYNRGYDETVSRFETTKAERDALAAEIRQRGIRRREFERFITTLETLPDEVTDFSEDLWGSLVEYLTVYAKDDLRSCSHARWRSRRKHRRYNVTVKQTSKPFWTSIRSR